MKNLKLTDVTGQSLRTPEQHVTNSEGSLFPTSILNGKQVYLIKT